MPKVSQLLTSDISTYFWKSWRFRDNESRLFLYLRLWHKGADYPLCFWKPYIKNRQSSIHHVHRNPSFENQTFLSVSINLTVCQFDAVLFILLCTLKSISPLNHFHDILGQVELVRVQVLNINTMSIEENEITGIFISKKEFVKFYNCFSSNRVFWKWYEY